MIKRIVAASFAIGVLCAATWGASPVAAEETSPPKPNGPTCTKCPLESHA